MSWWRSVGWAVCDVTADVNSHWSSPYSRSCSWSGRGDIFTGFTYSTWGLGSLSGTGTTSGLGSFPFVRSEKEFALYLFVLSPEMHRRMTQLTYCLNHANPPRLSLSVSGPVMTVKYNRVLHRRAPAIYHRGERGVDHEPNCNLCNYVWL